MVSTGCLLAAVYEREGQQNMCCGCEFVNTFHVKGRTDCLHSSPCTLAPAITPCQ